MMQTEVFWFFATVVVCVVAAIEVVPAIGLSIWLAVTASE